MKYAFFAAALLLPIAAHAGQPASACAHGETSMKIAGVDMDMMRCQLDTALRELANQAPQRVAVEAQLRAGMAALDAATEHAQALDEYWRKWCGDRPGCATAAAAPAP